MLSMVVFNERDSPWFQTVHWLYIMENGCITTSQVGPEIKYLLQEGMSGKGSSLAKPLRPLGTSLAWRLSFGLREQPGEHGGPGQEFGREQRGAYSLRPALPYQVSWHGPLSHKIGHMSWHVADPMCQTLDN